MKILTTRLTGAAWILVCLFWATGNLLWATPQQSVSGTVTDAQENPIPGVSIRLLNSNTGTQTDMQGIFSIQAQPGDTLSISYIGFKTNRLPVKNQTHFTIVLQQDITDLGEVTINAGYYNTTRREQTGSIARVSAAEIERQPVTNPLAALQGRMAGVNITQTTGVPGGGFDIEIRGRNSLRAGGNEPLYIIDGVPYNSQSLSNTNVSATLLPGANMSPLNTLNPYSISSIEILKDADATAIYGSRGANGVVLITTKQAKAGKTRFSLQAYTGSGKLTRTLELMNTEQYLEMRREAYANDGVTDYPANAYDINGTWDANKYTDWQETLIGGTATTAALQGAVTGGSETTRFRIGGGYQRETSVFPGAFTYHKLSVNSNLNHQSADQKFSINLTTSYSFDDNNQPGNDFTRDARMLPPNAPDLYTEDGALNWADSTWDNPLAQLEQDYRAKNHTLIANAVIGYQVTPHLKVSSSLGYNDRFLTEVKEVPSTFYNPAYGYGSDRSYRFTNDTRNQSWIIEPQLNYTLNMQNWKLDALLGATFQNQTTRSNVVYGQGYSNNSLISNLSAASFIFVLENGSTAYTYTAGFGRLNLKYKDRYILNLTGRRDGSSRFGPGKQFANFGAVGAAWIFSEEDVIQDSPWWSFGKLRGSYGITGSDAIGDYQFLDTYSITTNRYQGLTGITPTRLFNADFAWEENKKLELALELGFLKNRILLNTAYFKNRSGNQLVGIPLPGTTGFSSILANLDATVENSGWEFELSTVNFQNEKFNWSTSLNISFLRNELVSFPDLEGSTYANQYMVGEPLNIRKVYQYTGINPETGIYEFQDYDGDGSISFPNDRQAVLDLNPDFFGGLSNQVQWGAFELNFLLQFAKQQGSNYYATGSRPGIRSNQPVALLDRWQEPQDDAPFQKLTAGGDSEAVRAFSNYRNSSASVTDASYIRLKNASFSYNLPERLLQGVDARIYVQGQNLLTFTRYAGSDPETQRIDNLPPLRFLTLGLQANF